MVSRSVSHSIPISWWCCLLRNLRLDNCLLQVKPSSQRKVNALISPIETCWGPLDQKSNVMISVTGTGCCVSFEICHWSSRTNVTLVWGKPQTSTSSWSSKLEFCNYLKLKDSIAAIRICHYFAHFRRLQITAVSFFHPVCMPLCTVTPPSLPSIGGIRFPILLPLGRLCDFF